jgi:two-component system C4-dicarboxylate transport sensor histidine kinase DctB
MRARTLVALLLSIAVATLLFHLIVHAVAGVWLDVMLRPEVRNVVEESLADQKALRDFDPANAARYRRRFEERQRLLNRIEVVAISRQRLLQRFEAALSGTFAVALFAATFFWTIRQRRGEERRRREYLDRLSGWQEASRRHAHEMKTPLTAARMEVDRLISLTSYGASEHEVRLAVESVYEEFDRLTRFTKEFSSFAALGQPLLREENAAELLDDFCRMFANAWPGLTLRVAGARGTIVDTDRDLLRQVLVNLVTNSAHATNGPGTVTFDVSDSGDRVFIDVSDTGSGIPASIQPRVFEPYVTTRKIGAGMGLGLAISRKILLDQGGDLTLLSSSPSGTTFRLALVRAR